MGRVIEEHLAEFARYLPPEAEIFPLTDLRAAAEDLRYLQSYLAARGRAQFEDSGLTEEQNALCLLASRLALDLAPLRARLQAALPDA